MASEHDEVKTTTNYQSVYINTFLRTISQQPQFGTDQSHRMSCPHCHEEISTQVETKPSFWAWASGLCLCVIG